MKKFKEAYRTILTIIVLVFIFAGFYIALQGCSDDPVTNTTGTDTSYSCGQYGTPPIRTVYPVTIPLKCEDGELLSWQQSSVIRYACLNYPEQASTENHKWPLVVFLHGSIASPMSIYTLGKEFFALRDSYQLSDSASVQGFILLSPEGRIAKPYTGPNPETGEGFHWDTWYRNPAENLDALAIDHFIDEVVATGKVDTKRIYVWGWSNGAFMTVLYSSWRSSRIAAMGQYAGANPWTRTPCPVPMSYTRQVPLYLMRNLCDALVPCSLTKEWINNLDSTNWPHVNHSLNYVGDTVSQSMPCYTDCTESMGLACDIRFPRLGPILGMLQYFKEHPLN